MAWALINEHLGWRQGYWEAEESGEKMLCEYKRVSLGLWYETSKKKEASKKIVAKKLGKWKQERIRELDGHAEERQQHTSFATPS